MTETERIGLEIAKLRKERGLTQAQLAQLANMTQQQVGKIEKAYFTATIETLSRIAKALDRQITLINNSAI